MTPIHTLEELIETFGKHVEKSKSEEWHKEGNFILPDALKCMCQEIKSIQESQYLLLKSFQSLDTAINTMEIDRKAMNDEIKAIKELIDHLPIVVDSLQLQRNIVASKSMCNELYEWHLENKKEIKTIKESIKNIPSKQDYGFTKKDFLEEFRSVYEEIRVIKESQENLIRIVNISFDRLYAWHLENKKEIDEIKEFFKIKDTRNEKEMD